MVKITTICVLLIARLQTPSSELYSSVAKMAPLLQTQAHVIRATEEAIQHVFKKERRILKVFLANLKKDHAIFEQNPEHFLGNPINAVTLIMRLYRDLQYVEGFLNKTSSYKRDASLVYPQKDDAYGAIYGILRIQLMYDLDVVQIANGTLITNISKSGERFVEKVTPMTSSDCYDFAKEYFDEEDRSMTIAWLVEAHRRYQRDRLLCSFAEEELVKRIAVNHYFMKNWRSTIFWLEKSLILNQHDVMVHVMLEQAKKHHEEEQKTPQIHQKAPEKINLPLMQLCQNKLHLVGTNARLFCHYTRGPDSFLILAPIKTELLYEEPYIAMFYDVITDEESEQLKTLAKPQLNRATIIDDNLESQAEDTRVSQTFAVPHFIEPLKRVVRRVHQFSGLQWSRFSSEVAQIANYGIGGQFEAHNDVTEKGLLVRELRRLATALIYMSDVEQGGATVFVYINLTVFPVKNAALFWYNMDPWGNVDVQTRHAACPVLRGSKWVLTKWINMFGQEFTRPCPAHPIARHRRQIRRLLTRNTNI